MRDRLRVAFYTRGFGIRGTPGTYRMIEKLCQFCDVVVFAPPTNSKNLVHSSDAVTKCILSRIIPEDFNSEVILPLKKFKPDIVYIINFPGWYEVAALLKNGLPKVRILLDIKTPLLVPESKGRYQIQEFGDLCQKNIDLVLTLSSESVFTWIPNCKVKIETYPLGLDIRQFLKIDMQKKVSRLRKYVYVATLHPLRNTSELIVSFIDFYNATSGDVSLDIYGNGPDYETLSDLINDLGVSHFVRLKGLVEQKELLIKLSEYDAGIAWVPKEHYDKSPSLKLLEYMASGLVVAASDTAAHMDLESLGFHINYFQNNSSSLVSVLLKLYSGNFDLDSILINRKLVANFDYDVIAINYIIPIMHRTLDSKNSVRLDSEQNIASKIVHASSKLKIVLLSNTLALGKGGAEKVAAYLANEMSRRGHAVYIAYQGNGQPAYKLIDGVTLLPFSRLSELNSLISSVNPDVFHAFYFNRQLVNYYYLVYNTGIPFTMQECTNPTRLITNNWGAKKIDPVTARWEREIIASGAVRIRLVMPSYKNSFPRYIQNSIRAFSNPCYVNTSTALSRDSDSLNEIIIVNGFKGNKNLITLLMAFNQIKDFFEGWNVKVVGNNDGEEPHKKLIREFIASNGLTSRVSLVGATENIEIEYAKSKIHVIASLSEGCPTCVLEAMSFGIPSVGFDDCPGTNELILHRQNGLLANSADRVIGLRDALHELMSDETLRHNLGRQALSDSVAYSPKNIYDQWEEFFTQASLYKNDLNKLYVEQAAIDPEAARHSRRMREYYSHESNRVHL